MISRSGRTGLVGGMFGFTSFLDPVSSFPACDSDSQWELCVEGLVFWFGQLRNRITVQAKSIVCVCVCVQLGSLYIHSQGIQLWSLLVSEQLIACILQTVIWPWPYVPRGTQETRTIWPWLYPSFAITNQPRTKYSLLVFQLCTWILNSSLCPPLPSATYTYILRPKREYFINHFCVWINTMGGKNLEHVSVQMWSRCLS